MLNIFELEQYLFQILTWEYLRGSPQKTDNLTDLVLKLLSCKEFFITSFSEGNALSTLTVKVSENISELDNENFLVSKIAEGNKITYTFASSNFNKLKEKEIDIRSSYNPSSIELNR